MKSLESTHVQSQASEVVPQDEEPRLLPRRGGGGAAPAGGGASAPSNAASLFGGAVNSGIRALQYKGGRDLDGAHAHQLAASGFAGGGGALPHQEAIQRSFGKHDIGGVRAHVGGPAAQAADALGAVGYAAGDAVAFANSPDLRLAAHEAAHIVQQRGGVRLSGGVGASGDEYERHADEVADLVVRGQSAEAVLDRYAHRGSAGGSAVQLQRHRHHGHGHGHGGGGTAPGAPPSRAVGDSRAAAHVLQEPDATEVLAEMRRQLSVTAASYGAEFPTQAFNALQVQLQTVIAQHGYGALTEQTVTVPGGMYTYRFRLWGSVSHGPPTDVRAQRGRGTLSEGSQDQTGYGDTTQATDGTTDTLSGQATGSSTPAQATGGRGGSLQASGSHQSTHTEQGTVTSSDTHQGTASTSMQGQLEHIEYVSQVSVQLQGICEVVHDGWSAMGRFFGTESTDSTQLGTGRVVIGEVPLAQQTAAHPGGGGPHRPERLQ